MIIILIIGMLPKPNPKIVIAHKTYGGIMGGSSTCFYDENGNVYSNNIDIPLNNDYLKIENLEKTRWIPPIIIRAFQLQSFFIINHNYSTKESRWESITDGMGEIMYLYKPIVGSRITLKEMNASNGDTTYICSINGNIISFIVSEFL